MESWKEKGFNAQVSRQQKDKDPNFIGGDEFDAKLDTGVFNRIIRFRNLSKEPQGNQPGKTYYDPETKRLRIWTGAGGWANVAYTTTSTSTTSSSTSSTSTSTTSTSISTTSSSTSTTTTI